VETLNPKIIIWETNQRDILIKQKNAHRWQFLDSSSRIIS